MRSRIDLFEPARRWIAGSGERELAATLIGAIALGGSLIGFFSYLFAHPEGTDYLAPSIAFSISIIAGAVVLRRRTSVGWPVIAALVALGSAVVTVAMVSVPDRTGAYASYYVWLGIFSFYFLRPSWALIQIAWIGALYAGAIAIDAPPGPAEQWLNGVATTLGVGLLILALRTWIDSLLASLEAAASTDELTGLPNRRAFDEQLERELQRSIRTGSEVSLVLLDLDRFKLLNDTTGHLEGDEALRSLAAVIRNEVRVMDWPARVGGDEFAILLPDADPEEAERVARRLRAGVEREFADDSVPLLASLGVTSRRGREITATGMLEEADRALYGAKRGGGDRVQGAPRPHAASRGSGERAA